MRLFQITEEQIKRLAFDPELSVDLTYLMHRWFPAAFETEWEEVPFKSLIPVATYVPEKFILRDLNATDTHGYPIEVLIREEYRKDYKIEDGKIWRRKA